MKRAKLISSGESLVNEETKYLPKVCHEGSDYTISIINKIGQQEFSDCQNKKRTAETNETPNKIQLIFPYSGKQGNKLMAKKKKHIKKILTENIQTIVTYQSKKLSTEFTVKQNFIIKII